MSRSEATPGGPKAGKTEGYHHGNLRQVLLEAALALATEVGVDGFTLREAARRAGVSHAAPYHHFKDKAALIQALADQSLERLDRASRAAAEGIEHPVQRLNRIGEAYVLFAFEHPAEFRVMFRPELGSPLASQDEHGMPTDGAFRLLYETVLDCEHAGCPLGADPETASLSAWATVHGLATLIVDGPLGGSLATASDVRALVRRVLGGSAQSDLGHRTSAQ